MTNLEVCDTYANVRSRARPRRGALQVFGAVASAAGVGKRWCFRAPFTNTAEIPHLRAAAERSLVGQG
jgi:hypothetical protein